MKTKLLKFASEYFLFVSVVEFVLMFVHGDFTGWARCIGQILLAFAIGCKLDYKNIAYGLGVVGLRNTLDPTFYYSPVTEGFKAGYSLKGVWKDFSDVLRRSNKTFIGYNKRLNKIYLLVVKNVAHSDLINIITESSSFFTSSNNNLSFSSCIIPHIQSITILSQ